MFYLKALVYALFQSADICSISEYWYMFYLRVYIFFGPPDLVYVLFQSTSIYSIPECWYMFCPKVRIFFGPPGPKKWKM